jgi:hypothetical protein
VLLQGLKGVYLQTVVKFRENEFIQKVKYYCPRSTHSFILFGIRKSSMISGRSLILHQFTRTVKLTIVNSENYHSFNIRTKCYATSLSQNKVRMWIKLLGIISFSFDVTRQLLAYADDMNLLGDTIDTIKKKINFNWL